MNRVLTILLSVTLQQFNILTNIRVTLIWIIECVAYELVFFIFSVHLLGSTLIMYMDTFILICILINQLHVIRGVHFRGGMTPFCEGIIGEYIQYAGLQWGLWSWI